MRYFTICLAALGLMMGLAAAQAAPDAPPRPEPAPVLVVSGHGEVAGTPDRATVRLGADTMGADAMAAQNALNTIMGKVLQSVKALGIEDRYIQTSNLNLYPTYTNKPNSTEPQTINGYHASSTVQITVNKLNLVGQVVDAAVTAGANQMQGISFDLQNDLPQRTEALKNAVGEARIKAETIAQALGVHITGIAEVNEGGVSIVSPQPLQMYAMARSSAMMATPVQAGELHVQASVTVRYRIAP